MLWVGSPDSKQWVYKRKGTVLRLFNKIKLAMWDAHIEECQHHLQPITSEEEWVALCRTVGDEY